MNDTSDGPLEPAGLESPPSNPFDTPMPHPPGPPASPKLVLNRKARRALRASTLADTRLLVRVAAFDDRTSGAAVDGAPRYPTELAATYGLEHAAERMRRKQLLTNAEALRVKHLARNRRNALKGAPA